MPSVAKIIYAKASKEYKSGAVSLDWVLARLDEAPGHIKSYVGYETEDPTVLFWVNVWTSKEARDAFAKQPVHEKIVAAARLAFDYETTSNYVEFEDTTGPLGAPITEFVTFTLKEGRSITELEPLVQQIHQKLAGIPKFQGDSWGVVLDKPNVYHGILGWDSEEAHWEAVSKDPLKGLIDEVREIADLWLVHATLGPFSG